MTMYDEAYAHVMKGLRDCGENTESAGGTRYSENKPSMWWAMPLAGLREVARVTEYGSGKYAPLDWAEGQGFSTLVDCMARHFVELVEKGVWSRDAESGQLHMAHLTWNALCLLTFIGDSRYDLDDITGHRGRVAGEEPSTGNMKDAARDANLSSSDDFLGLDRKDKEAL